MTEQAIVKAVTTNGFEALMNEAPIALVDFWAPWCAPCRQFARVYEQVAALYPTIVFAKVNIEEEPTLAEMFHIRSIPHLMVMKQGIVIYSEAGSMPASTLKELVEQAIKADVSAILAQIQEDGGVSGSSL